MATAEKTERNGAADIAASQITELATAFRAFRTTVPQLGVEVVGHVAGSQQYVHPVAGFHVRLPGDEGTGIDLYVSSRYGELVRWRRDAGALRERFDVRLSDSGYGWGDSEYPTADELAHDLLAYMQYNLDALRRG